MDPSTFIWAHCACRASSFRALCAAWHLPLVWLHPQNIPLSCHFFSNVFCYPNWSKRALQPRVFYSNSKSFPFLHTCWAHVAVVLSSAGKWGRSSFPKAWQRKVEEAWKQNNIQNCAFVSSGRRSQTLCFSKWWWPYMSAYLERVPS